METTGSSSRARAGLRARPSRGGVLFLCQKTTECGRTTEERETERRREQRVLSDSENEEPMSRKIKNISAFITKTHSSLYQRSRSSDPVEDRGKLRVILQPALDSQGACGILLSSENSRSVSAPLLPPQRRLAWSAVFCSPAPSSSNPAPCNPSPSPAPAERSVSPDSNDSISEELNHFKPIVCSPRTPPKPPHTGLGGGVIKATPRNLRTLSGHAQSSWLHSSRLLLQKWKQIELDRQNIDPAHAEGTGPAHVEGTGSAHAEGTGPAHAAGTGPAHAELRNDSRNKRRSLERPGFFLNSSKRRCPDVSADAKCGANNANANSSVKRRRKANASFSVSSQEAADRALALALQRHFDGVHDPYFLRSTNQSAESGRSLRSEDRGRSLRSGERGWSLRSEDRGRSRRSEDKGRSLRQRR